MVAGIPRHSKPMTRKRHNANRHARKNSNDSKFKPHYENLDKPPDPLRTDSRNSDIENSACPSVQLTTTSNDVSKRILGSKSSEINIQNSSIFHDPEILSIPHCSKSSEEVSYPSTFDDADSHLKQMIAELGNSSLNEEVRAKAMADINFAVGSIRSFLERYVIRQKMYDFGLLRAFSSLVDTKVDTKDIKSEMEIFLNFEKRDSRMFSSNFDERNPIDLLCKVLNKFSSDKEWKIVVDYLEQLSNCQNLERIIEKGIDEKGQSGKLLNRKGPSLRINKFNQIPEESVSFDCIDSSTSDDGKSFSTGPTTPEGVDNMKQNLKKWATANDLPSEAQELAECKIFGKPADSTSTFSSDYEDDSSVMNLTETMDTLPIIPPCKNTSEKNNILETSGILPSLPSPTLSTCLKTDITQEIEASLPELSFSEILSQSFECHQMIFTSDTQSSGKTVMDSTPISSMNEFSPPPKITLPLLPGIAPISQNAPPAPPPPGIAPISKCAPPPPPLPGKNMETSAPLNLTSLSMNAPSPSPMGIAPISNCAPPPPPLPGIAPMAKNIPPPPPIPGLAPLSKNAPPPPPLCSNSGVPPISKNAPPPPPIAGIAKISGNAPPPPPPPPGASLSKCGPPPPPPLPANFSKGNLQKGLPIPPAPFLINGKSTTSFSPVSNTSPIVSPGVVKSAVVYRKQKKTLIVRWQKLNPMQMEGAGTVFNDSLCVDFNEEERNKMEEIFEEVPAKQPVRTIGGSVGRAFGAKMSKATSSNSDSANICGKSPTTTQVLCSPKALTIEILLKKLKPFSFMDLIRKLEENDTEGLKVDLMGTLHANYPEPDELAAFENVELRNLSHASDQFCWHISKKPTLKLRIELLITKENVVSEIFKFQSQIEVLTSAIQAARGTLVQMILRKCLQYGNYLNQGSMFAEAAGFSLSYLNNLLQLKGKGQHSSIRLADLLVGYCDFSTIEIEEVQGKMVAAKPLILKELNQAVDQVERTIKKLDGAMKRCNDEALINSYAPFMQKTSERLVNVRNGVDDLHAREAELRIYLCAGEMPLQNIFEILGQALKTLFDAIKNAASKNRVQRATSMLSLPSTSISQRSLREGEPLSRKSLALKSRELPVEELKKLFSNSSFGMQRKKVQSPLAKVNDNDSSRTDCHRSTEEQRSSESDTSSMGITPTTRKEAFALSSGIGSPV